MKKKGSENDRSRYPSYENPSEPPTKIQRKDTQENERKIDDLISQITSACREWLTERRNLKGISLEIGKEAQIYQSN